MKSDPRYHFLEAWGLQNLLTGRPLVLYHGSSRKFAAFDADKTRTQLVDLYYGGGLFFVPKESVAWDYAYAARNADLPVSAVDDVERAHPEIGRFMRRSMMSGGLEWPEEWAHLTQREIDLFYEAASVVPYVEGSRAPRPRMSAFEELLGQTSGITLSAYKGLHQLIGRRAEDYFPRIYAVTVQAENPLVTNDLDHARRGREEGYDSVVYLGEYAVGDVPEVAIFDPARVKVVATKVMTLDDSDPTWSTRLSNPTEHAYLPLEEVRRWETLAARQGVSEIARSTRGFLARYKRAEGHPERMNAGWRATREAFIARHMAEVEKNHEPLFLGGLPSRRHLAFIMWAYSPQAARLERTEPRLSNPVERMFTEDEVQAKIAALRAALARMPAQERNRRCGRRRWDAIERSLRELPWDDDPTGQETEEFFAWMTSILDPDPEEQKRERAAAKAERAKERAEKAYESQGVDVSDDTRAGRAALDKKLRGKRVWLYHGTSTTQVPRILADGLTFDKRRKFPETTPGVYLTASAGNWNDGGSAAWYARRAAAKFGGDPAVLRVLVDYDDLEWDSDDEDIATGNYQWRTDMVPPQDIKEVNGERVR